MSDDKRTYEINTHLLGNPRLQPRPLKGQGASQPPAPASAAEEPSRLSSLPLTQDLILRLIKVLRET